VAAGTVDLVITLISEILPASGVDLVGALPAKFQNYVSFQAGLSANSLHPEDANNLIEILTGPLAVPVFKANGMEMNLPNIRPSQDVKP
jgi:ABC-type molybdate transport system substrate-binding protein